MRQSNLCFGSALQHGEGDSLTDNKNIAENEDKVWGLECSRILWVLASMSDTSRREILFPKEGEKQRRKAYVPLSLGLETVQH